MTTPSEPLGNDDEVVGTRQLDTICLFDVDGTITMPRQVIRNEDFPIEMIFNSS
jgi:hypothetical protein